MNIKQPLYARVTIGDSQTSLGFSTMDNLLDRLIRTVSKSRTGGKAQFVVEFSEEQLTESIMSQDQRLHQEFLALHSEPSDDDMFPGWSYAAILAVTETPEHKDLAFFANHPDKRIGADEEIRRAKTAFDSKFPGLLALGFPAWIN